jgi:hypothetical protein
MEERRKKQKVNNSIYIYIYIYIEREGNSNSSGLPELETLKGRAYKKRRNQETLENSDNKGR